jgi:hypothetical protein
VIVAHRLLKNEIDSHEYVLITGNLSSSYPDWLANQQQAWSPIYHAEQEYDSGRIEYDYISMASLKEDLPPLSEEDLGLPGFPANILEASRVIHAPIDLIFNVVVDLRWRSKWIPGLLPEIENLNSELTQPGQTHKCLAGGPVMIGHDYHVGEERISFTETDVKKTFCTVYVFTKVNETTTEVSTTCYIPGNWLMELMFKVLQKKKYKKMYNTALLNLDTYCTELSSQGRQHPYQIQMAYN